jgi:hypothetical protein
LKVNYESTVDWCLARDLLRANPSFHNKLRYDCIIIKVDEGKYIFARLLYIFGYTIDTKDYLTALIQPMDLPPSSHHRTRNRDLRFTHVRARQRSLSVFISVESIVRGALLVEDFGAEYGDEYLVIDVVDSDMWLWLKTLALVQRVNL